MCKLGGWTMLVLAAGPQGWAAEPFVKNSEDRARIEQAVPRQAIVRPAKPRRLLIFTLNVGYGGHPSIAYANEAFRLMGQETGAFETTVSEDPSVFRRETLSQFDAVFFNNTVGNCFTNADLRQNLIEFIVSGGGLLGVHGTTVAFTRWPGAYEDWPEFGFLLGARGANHKDSDEHVWIRLDDPGHPLTRVFDATGFEYRDEFFRPQGTYSRQRVRVLLTIDTTRTDVNQGQARGDCFRADQDYALAWIRNYGRGRIFYSTIAHNPYVFYDPKMLRFYLGAIQFALGDLQAPTTPSARLSPAIRAQEQLGWRLAVDSSAFGQANLFEAIEEVAKLGLGYFGAVGWQRVSRDLPVEFGPQLSDKELSQVRLKLESVGLRLLTYSPRVLPSDEAGWRQLYEFGRKMGIEMFLCEPPASAMDLIERFSVEYGIDFALDSGPRKNSSLERIPAAVLGATEGRSKRIGTCGDIGDWLESGVDPVKAARRLKNRLLAVRFSQPTKASSGRENADARRSRATARLLGEIQRLGLKPTFIIESKATSTDATNQLAQWIDFFDTACSNLTRDR